MYFPAIVILTFGVSICEISCQTSSYGYSIERPWTIVYPVYPFYNSETLLEVWKTDRTDDVSTNVVTHDEESIISYSDNNARRNDTDLNGKNNVQYFVGEAAGTNQEKFSNSRQRLSSYRNPRKDSTQ